MKVLSLVTQKGGSGKSTLTASLAVCAHSAGLRVLSIDMDPQHTLTEFAKLRKGAPPAVATLPDNASAQLPGLLASARGQFDLVLLDTPGADSPATHAAMSAADFCLVPLRPTRPDALALRVTVDALIRSKRRFAFCLNQCLPNARSARASEMAAGLITLGLLAEPPICQRADFQDAFAAGQGVTEYAPASKAAAEITSLWNWIRGEMNNG